MPKLIKETPEKLRPYVAFGLDLDFDSGSREALGDCPLCGREGRFSVNIEKGLYHCLKCEEKGNSYNFVERILDLSFEATTDYEELVQNRGLTEDTLIAWGVCRSIIDGTWLVPAKGTKKTRRAYRYVNGKLLATPGHSHGLHGLDLFSRKKQIVYVCEGPWDGMAWWETLRAFREEGDGSVVPTANRKENLLAFSNVVATPGANVFNPEWAKVFSGKSVYFLYDNDHPKTHPKSGKVMEPVGIAGMRRATKMIGGSAEDVNAISWGPDGVDLDLPSGYDLRDALRPRDLAPNERGEPLGVIMSLLCPVPDTWLEGVTKSKPVESIEMKECTSYRALVTAWRKAMKWTDGLDYALSVMLSGIVSVPLLGDQLWLKVMGPASCGKSTLCEAMKHADYVYHKSTIRGFHSGFKSDRTGEEDNSLLFQINNKALITKDGDTLLQSPNLGQILSEARDLYDTTSRSHYRNKMGRDYAGIRTSWILCGTSSLRSIDSSELGERFLDCIIMDRIDLELERDILWRVANKANRAVRVESNGSPETRQEPAMTEVMALTGGYIDYLRENATDILKEIEVTDESMEKCMDLGLFVSYMRARPSKAQEEVTEREFAARLVSQLMRLANCLAIVLNRTTIDDEVIRRVRRVAYDTAGGLTLKIAEYLHEQGYEGAFSSTIQNYTGIGDARIKALLPFLRSIGVVEQFAVKKKNGVRERRPKFRLTPELSDLMDRLEKL